MGGILRKGKDQFAGRVGVCDIERIAGSCRR
jgi:hypothetical protein